MNHGKERRKREEGKIVFKSVTFIDFVYDMIGETNIDFVYDMIGETKKMCIFAE